MLTGSDDVPVDKPDFSLWPSGLGQMEPAPDEVNVVGYFEPIPDASISEGGALSPEARLRLGASLGQEWRAAGGEYFS